MIRIIISIYFAVVCWQRAKFNGKSPVTWSAIGVLSFGLISGLIPPTALTIASELTLNRDALLGVGILSLIAGLIIAFAMTNYVLKRFLPKSAS